MKNLNQEIIKEFRKKFERFDQIIDWKTNRPTVEEFILKALKRKDEKFVKTLKGLKQTEIDVREEISEWLLVDNLDQAVGWNIAIYEFNDAIQDIINKIKGGRG